MANKLQPGGPCCLSCSSFLSLPESLELTLRLQLGDLPDVTAECASNYHNAASACSGGPSSPDAYDALPKSCQSYTPPTEFTGNFYFSGFQGSQQEIAAYYMRAPDGSVPVIPSARDGSCGPGTLAEACYTSQVGDGSGLLNIGTLIDHLGVPFGSHTMQDFIDCFDPNQCGGERGFKRSAGDFYRVQVDDLAAGYLQGILTMNCQTGVIDFQISLSRQMRFSSAFANARGYSGFCPFPTGFPANETIYIGPGTTHNLFGTAFGADLQAIGVDPSAIQFGKIFEAGEFTISSGAYSLDVVSPVDSFNTINLGTQNDVVSNNYIGGSSNLGTLNLPHAFTSHAAPNAVVPADCITTNNDNHGSHTCPSGLLGRTYSYYPTNVAKMAYGPEVDSATFEFKGVSDECS